jgi:peptide/nickel transport system permease protein
MSGVALWRRPAARRRLRLSRVMRFGRRGLPVLPVIILVVFVFVAITASRLTPYDPIQNDLTNSLTPPAWVDGGSSAHLLGTDSFGRDVFTRLLYGVRVSFLVAVLCLLIAVTIGVAVGVVSGYVGGLLDSLLMRIVDVMLALPMFLVALVLAIAVGASFRNLVLIVGLLLWPRIARLIRGEALLLKHQEFVRYSRAIGVPARSIMWRHVIPNVLPTLLVATTLEVGHVILLESSLSFLGAGIPQPQASWGVMIADGRALIATGWWIALFPGISIVLVVMSWNAIGDWLRDRFDPKSAEVN